MTTPAPPNYAGYRFPSEIISHSVCLYFRSPLSLRHVDEILAARGIVVSHETVRQWALKFRQAFANQIRRRLPQAGDKWHLDEVPGTMSLRLRIGRIIREARQSHRDAVAALIAFFPTTHYRHARLIFRGKVVDVDRRTERGFALAHVRIEGLREWAGTMELEVQNENLAARVGGKLRAIVPDLICVLETETAEPITTERLRYGQRVTVMAVAVPEIMCTPQALAVFGPTAFGMAEAYQPLDSIPV